MRIQFFGLVIGLSAALPVLSPAALADAPSVVGCADGQREGFESLTTYPDIAACGGAWSIPGIANFAPSVAPACPNLAVTDTRSPACGRAAGDDAANSAGAGCNAEDVCAAGWHICLDTKDIKASTPTPTNGCTGSVPVGSPGMWFASRQGTNGCGQCADGASIAANCNSAACTPGCLNTEKTTNDVFGCGSIGQTGTCSSLGMRWTGNLCSAFPAGSGWSCNLPTTADDSGLCETYTLLHTNPSTGGVLCCHDTTTPDTDGDGIKDNVDNCVGVYNPDQTDTNHDSFGDACQCLAVACVAADSCHLAGVCDPTNGACSNPVKPNGTACFDGNACTTGDVCTAGKCGGATINCSDNNVCTTESCSPTIGCTFTLNTSACNDGNACTSGDVCGGGTCNGATVSCDDANSCTTDSCDPASGCVHTSTTDPCDDGDLCTTGDTCAGGACVGGAPPNCDDGNVCTDDACAPAAGCLNITNSVSCTDGDACTTVDVCSNGSCVGDVALDCNDSNVCTDDQCNAATGCVHSDNTASCDDGNDCTRNDVCGGAACAGDACGANATCQTGGCGCDPGYAGDGFTCEDIDECADGNNGGCDVNANCTNTPGSAECSCKCGFVGDGITCTAEPLYVQSLTYGGTGCPQGSVGQSFASDRRSFTLIFDSFVASSGPGVPVTEGRKNCQVNLNLRVPPGATHQVLLMDYRGYAQLPAGVRARQGATYYTASTAAQQTTSATFMGPSSRDYMRRDCVALDLENAAACPITAPVNIQTSVELSGALNLSAQMTVDSIDGKLTAQVGTDTDADCVLDESDVCPSAYDPAQADADGDGVGDVCDNCVDAPNADQADDDGDGKGNVCDDCPFQGGLLANGASACEDAATRATCDNGVLTTESCGVDSCDDTGSTSGGGACSAVDYVCDAGVCGSIASAGTDSCGGTADAPSVTTYACSGGNTCVSSIASAADACADTGSAAGGGTCSAVDWTCGNGVLSSTTSAGVDTCHDGSTSQTTTFTCASSDGAAADACVPVLDAAAPTLSCPAPVVVTCTESTGTTTSIAASASDVCDSSAEIANSYTAAGADASGNYPVGATTVTFTASDDLGNESSCSTTVNVQWTAWSFAIYSGGKDDGVGLDHDAVVDGDVFSADELELAKHALIEGAGFAFDDVEVRAYAAVTGGVHANGSHTGAGAYTFLGPVPANLPSLPTLSDSCYRALLDVAATKPKGNVVKASLSLAGTTLYVNGQFELKNAGSLTGPGTIVATKDIKIGNGAVVGAGITLIAAGQLKVDHHATIAAGAKLYSAGTIQIDNNASLLGASVVAKGNITLASDSQVTGLLFALGDVTVGERATVTGTIIAYREVTLKHHAVVVHDCALTQPLPMCVTAGVGVAVPPPADNDHGCQHHDDHEDEGHEHDEHGEHDD